MANIATRGMIRAVKDFFRHFISFTAMSLWELRQNIKEVIDREQEDQINHAEIRDQRGEEAGEERSDPHGEHESPL